MNDMSETGMQRNSLFEELKREDGLLQYAVANKMHNEVVRLQKLLDRLVDVPEAHHRCGPVWNGRDKPRSLPVQCRAMPSFSGTARFGETRSVEEDGGTKEEKAVKVKVIDVVAALVGDGAGRVLMAQRPVGKAQTGLWEFPGGKIEPGETPYEALARECMEELGLEIEDERTVDSVVQYPEKTIRLTLIACSRREGSSPRPLEHQAIGWYTREDMASLPICPADVELINRIPEECFR